MLSNKNKIKYPFERTVMKVITVPANSPSFSDPNIFLGALPKKAVLFMIDSGAFFGSVNKNPWEFKRNNLNFLQFTVGGQSFPTQPLKMGKDEFSSRALHNLYNVAEVQGIGINRDNYTKGYFILGVPFINNTPGRGSGQTSGQFSSFSGNLQYVCKHYF